MDDRVVIEMGAELSKIAGVAQRVSSLITGSKAKALGAAAISRADEASMLRNIANAGGRWRPHGDARINARVRESAERVGRAATRLDGLRKQELNAVRLTRAGLGTAAAVGAGAAYANLEKRALLERLVRLGATDVPNTPRLLMKQRSPQELAGLQHGVQQWWGKKVTQPLMNIANKGLHRIPEGKVRNLATSGAKMVAQDPVGTVASWALIPVPGSEALYHGAKKGLERAIDRLAPLATTHTPVG